MIDAILTTPGGQRRDLRLPSCTLPLLETLQEAALVVEQAAQEERRSIKLTFCVKGGSVKLEFSALYD